MHVLTLAHLYYTLQSVVTGQAPITLDWKISSGGKQIYNTHIYIHTTYQHLFHC